MEENKSVDRNEGEAEMKEVKIELTETEEEEMKRKGEKMKAETPQKKRLFHGMMPFIGILALFICWQAEVVEGVMVLGCEDNMRSGANVGAWTTDLTFNAEGNFSVCVRFQFAQLHRTNIVYKMTGEGTRPILQLEVNVDNVRLCVKQVYQYHMMDRWLRPRRWYFVCAVYNQDLNQVITYFNGRVLKTYGLMQTPTKNASELTVAYVTRTPSPNKMTFIGNVTQFNIWSRELTPEEVFDLAYCLDDEDGDIVSWESAWNLEGAVTYQTNLTDLCKRSRYRDIEVFPASPYKEGVGMCEAMGGIISLPKNLTHSSSIVSAARLLRPECILLWIGVTDEEEEGSWTNHLSGRPVHYLPWSIDEPNGFHYENCGGVEAEGVVDDDCAALRCTSCEVAHDLVLTLHGSCETLTHNVNYMMSYKSGQRVFLGYGDYIILYDGTKWIWRDTTTRKIIAELLPNNLLPVGRRWWRLKRPVCNQKAFEIRRLLLSVCRPGHFTCDDGTCINLNLRCDLKYDCRDNSDESDCLLVRLPPDYKTSVAPRVAGWRYKEGSVGEVRSEVTLTNLRVDTAQMLLKVALNLTLSWLDPRLTYVNLKDDPSLNLVDNNVSEVWRPAVAPLNTVDKPPPSLPRDPLIHVHRHGLPQGDDNSLPEEVALYLGGDNPLVEQRGIQASFTCDFDLSRYPFDTQPCNLIFQLTPGSPKATRWAGEGSWVKYSGSSLLLEYMVGEVTLSHTRSTLQIHVPLARRNGNAVINIYVPSLTMLVVGYLTLFFLKDNFEARVMTSLTSLLVMATLFTQVAASLPKTSYFKLVDIWLLFCIFSTFFIIIFHIIIDLFVHEHERQRKVKDQSSLTSALFTSSGNILGANVISAPLFENRGQGTHHLRKDKDLHIIKDNRGPWNNTVLDENKTNLNKSFKGGSGNDKCMTDEKKFKDDPGTETSCVWTWLLPRASVKGVEIFSRVFMLIVFFMFNIIYWTIAYNG